MDTFAKRLKYARERKELTQAQLAHLIGLKFQSAVGNWETGARKQPRNILALAAALGVRPEWLESGSGAMLIADQPHFPVDAFEEIARILNGMLIVGSDKAEIMALIKTKHAQSLAYQDAIQRQLNIGKPASAQQTAHIKRAPRIDLSGKPVKNGN